MMQMIRARWCGYGALAVTMWLAGCEMLLPRPSMGSWQYPDTFLSAQDCPAFDGTYEGMDIENIGFVLAGFVDSVSLTVSDGYLYMRGIANRDSRSLINEHVAVTKGEQLEGKIKLFDLKKQQGPIGGVYEFETSRGCYEDRYVIHITSYHVGNGETRGNSVQQEEKIFEKVKDGDVQLTVISKVKSRNSWGGIDSSPEKTTVTLIKRIP